MRVRLRNVAAILLLAGACVRLAAWGAAEDPQVQSGKSSYDFDQSIQNYLKGDSQQAIHFLDEALQDDPTNERAKVFLLKVLVERGSRLFLAKQYPKAYDYLSRAYHMDSSNQQVRQMFEIASRQVAPPPPAANVMLIPPAMREQMLQEEAAQSARAQSAPETAARQPATLSSASVSRPASASAQSGRRENPPMAAAPAGAAKAPAFAASGEEYLQNVSAMMNLLASFQQRQEKQLEQFMVPLDRLQRMYYQSEQDRKNFINQLDQRFKGILGDVSFQQRLVIYGLGTGLILLGGIVWGFLLIIRRMRSRREEMIMKYQQEMMKMMRDMAALPGGAYAAALPGVGSTPRLAAAAPTRLMMPDQQNPSQAKPADHEVAGPDPMTLSGNYKQRALAAVQMTRVDAEKAVEMLKVMLSAPDSFQRESVAYALGTLFHPLTLDLLVAASQDSEQRVRQAAFRSLKRLLDLPPEDIPEEARRKIGQIMKASGSSGRSPKNIHKGRSV